MDDERWDNESNTSELQAEFIQAELDAQAERVRVSKGDPGPAAKKLEFSVKQLHEVGRDEMHEWRIKF